MRSQVSETQMQSEILNCPLQPKNLRSPLSSLCFRIAGPKSSCWQDLEDISRVLPLATVSTLLPWSMLPISLGQRLLRESPDTPCFHHDSLWPVLHAAWYCDLQRSLRYKLKYKLFNINPSQIFYHGFQVSPFSSAFHSVKFSRQIDKLVLLLLSLKSLLSSLPYFPLVQLKDHLLQDFL